jgi:hypothetical protein
MANTKKYFHDHLVLLLLSINAFLAIAVSLFIILRLSTSHGTVYIVQDRSSLGINRFQPGSVTDILAFVVFAILTLAISIILSIGAYKIHRQLTIIILSLGILLLTLTVIVSNALLVLR